MAPTFGEDVSVVPCARVLSPKWPKLSTEVWITRKLGSITGNFVDFVHRAQLAAFPPDTCEGLFYSIGATKSISS